MSCLLLTADPRRGGAVRHHAGPPRTDAALSTGYGRMSPVAALFANAVAVPAVRRSLSGVLDLGSRANSARTDERLRHLATLLRRYKGVQAAVGFLDRYKCLSSRTLRRLAAQRSYLSPQSRHMASLELDRSCRPEDAIRRGCMLLQCRRYRLSLWSSSRARSRVGCSAR